MMTGKN